MSESQEKSGITTNDELLLGTDVGNTNTKTSTGWIIPSLCSRTGDRGYNNEPIVINNVEYFLGYGKNVADYDKANDEIHRALVVASMIVTGRHNFTVSVGLPLDKYDKEKDALKKSIEEIEKCDIVYKGEQYLININKVYVERQGISALYSMDNLNEFSEALLIDIGGQTIDTSEIKISNGRLHVIKPHSFPLGVARCLFPEYIKEFNNKNKSHRTPSEANEILQSDLKRDSKKYDLTFSREVFKNYVSEITDELSQVYTFNDKPIILSGGAMVYLTDEFYNRFSGYNISVIDNPLFANANGYSILAAIRGGVTN